MFDAGYCSTVSYSRIAPRYRARTPIKRVRSHCQSESLASTLRPQTV